jgi:glycosyltransferase involved in cell wall biosynthesis
MVAAAPEHWGKLHLVRCGVSRADESSVVRSVGTTRILCVGRFSPEKGHLILLDALAELRNKDIDVCCTLVGDGPMRPAIEARAAELRLRGSLVLTGSLDPERVAELYQTATVIVLASFSEGVPVVLMEALARGKPVVATRVGGVPELIEDGRSGLIVAPGDAQALAEALWKIINDPEWAQSLGRNGRQRVRAEFNTDESARQLIELFHRSHRMRIEAEPMIGRKDKLCAPELTSQDS